MLENTEKIKLYLAALLHDIGKFWQRVDDKELDLKKYAPEKYCPVYEGKYTHQHVLWTAQFIEQKLNIIENEETSLARLAALHHNPPQNTLFQIISLANNLASGMQRNTLTNDAKCELELEKHKNKPLIPIFANFSRKDNASSSYATQPKTLCFKNDNIMPQKNLPPNEFSTEIKKSWNNFLNDLKKLPTNRQNIYNYAFADTLLFLLQKHTANIPSSFSDLPDVSLYDHSKSTAAFAVCLYEFLKQNPNLSMDDLHKPEIHPFLLFGADLSGIQNYIFDIVSKHAAKNLKGRSFFIHLITTTLAKAILDTAQLFEANIIYNSGGSLHILLPNTPSIHQILKEIQIEVQAEIFEKLNGVIYISMATEPFATSDLLDTSNNHDKQNHHNNLNKIWQQLYEKKLAEKNRRFKELLLNEKGYNSFFVPFGEEGEEIVKDAITGEPLKTKEARSFEDIGKVSTLTKEQIIIGEALKQAEYWLISPYDKKDNQKHVTELFGYKHYLTKTLQDIPDGLLEHEQTKLLAINNTNFLDPYTLPNFEKILTTCILGFEPYGGNDYPTTQKGVPKPYDHLPKGKFNKNAVVRMDVDNLGYLFQNGFTPEQRVFSRYSQLSRSLDLFFKGYLTDKWEKCNEFKEHIVIVYSGGDDLFLIGDWQSTMKFAEEIRNEFRQYVCQHPLITLSGGITLAPPKYPVLQMAEECEDAEKLAKSYVWKSDKHISFLNNKGEFISKPKEKDAVAFLNHALAWDNEYSLLKKEAEELAKKIQKERLPSAILQKIISYYEISGIEGNKDNEIQDPRVLWLLSYDFSRAWERNTNHKPYLQGIVKDVVANTWKNAPNPSQYHALKLYAIAARWAEIIVRNEK